MLQMPATLEEYRARQDTTSFRCFPYSSCTDDLAHEPEITADDALALMYPDKFGLGWLLNSLSYTQFGTLIFMRSMKHE